MANCILPDLQESFSTTVASSFAALQGEVARNTERIDDLENKVHSLEVDINTSNSQLQEALAENNYERKSTIWKIANKEITLE